ncbi:MAG: Zn-dependent protease [Anaerolinea sp.]|nr:Zn-dependent protease [Anaerolinea sp.]
MTYSIVALDERTGELGVAVQTRWLAVGSVVPWARPGVGAIATQSFVDARYGYVGLELLAAGRTPEAALAELLAADPDPGVRQVGIVDAAGRAVAHTGADCVAAAGHLAGAGVTVQANMMERATVWPAMLAAYESASGDLADRLVTALRAAEAEGGDVRGRQSAALVVVPGTPGAHPWEVRFDVRVDDLRAPLDELERLLSLNRAYEALDDALESLAVGELTAAMAFAEQAAALAPDDDQIRLWQALTVFDSGDEARGRRLYRSALEIEPRAGEHLRRFVTAGQLPGAERLVARLTAEER